MKVELTPGFWLFINALKSNPSLFRYRQHRDGARYVEEHFGVKMCDDTFKNFCAAFSIPTATAIQPPDVLHWTEFQYWALQAFELDPMNMQECNEFWNEALESLAPELAAIDTNNRGRWLKHLFPYFETEKQDGQTFYIGIKLKKNAATYAKTSKKLKGKEGKPPRG